MSKTSWYGWKPDLPDIRDLSFKEPVPVLISVDLRSQYILPPVVNQLSLGSCTGNGIASVVYFDLLNKHFSKPDVQAQPSRLFIYYNERVIEGTVSQDAGAQIRDGIKAIAKYGVCPESEWKYTISKFKTKPLAKCYSDAMQFKALKYMRVDNTDKAQLVSALQSGYPIVFGFTVYDSFESDAVAKTGIVPMPTSGDNVAGGHCVYCIGYDSTRDWFICVNSWGADWGDKGVFYLPAAYITNKNLADDFWVINSLL